MKIDEWIGLWMNRVKTTRFDAIDLYEMYLCKVTYDFMKGMEAFESANECLEEIEDFITRYSKVK